MGSGRVRRGVSCGTLHHGGNSSSRRSPGFHPRRVERDVHHTFCQAPINPINGFWFYRFIKLKTGEGGCDPYSDGRHAVQHRRDWSGYVTVRIGIKVRKRLDIVIAPSPSGLVKHIYGLASLRRDHFCFNVEDSLNRLRPENIFPRPFGD